MFKDYYKVLKVDPEADTDLIEKAYKVAAKKYHPDASPDPDAAKRFMEITEAYETLKDPLKRRGHDEERKRHLEAEKAGRERKAKEEAYKEGAMAARRAYLADRKKRTYVENGNSSDYARAAEEPQIYETELYHAKIYYTDRGAGAQMMIQKGYTVMAIEEGGRELGVCGDVKKKYWITATCLSAFSAMGAALLFLFGKFGPIPAAVSFAGIAAACVGLFIGSRQSTVFKTLRIKDPAQTAVMLAKAGLILNALYLFSALLMFFYGL